MSLDLSALASHVRRWISPWIRPWVRRIAYNLNPFNFPDDCQSWIPKGIQQALRISSRTPFDVVYSSASGPGLSAHFIARRVSAQLRVPWVHEYRDLWVRNPWRSTTPYWWRDRLELHWERTFLMQAQRAVVMHERLARILADRHPARLGGRIEVVPNGFDPDEFPPHVRPPAGLPLRLCFTGSLYGGKRDLSGLFKAIRLLEGSEHTGPSDLVFSYSGPDGALACALAERFGVERYLQDMNIVPAVEAKRLQLSSHLLVLVEAADDDPCIQANVPGKAYEYLGAGRPVLALVHPQGSVAALFTEARAGVSAHPNDVEAIAEHLRSAVRELGHGGVLHYAPNSASVRNGAWECISRGLVRILDEVVAAG